MGNAKYILRKKMNLSKMLLFTAFILVFALSSVESVDQARQDCIDRYLDDMFYDIPDITADFNNYDENYDDIKQICDHENPVLNKTCIETYYKENILDLKYDNLVKHCTCTSEDCRGSVKNTAGFGTSISGKKLMCGYVLCIIAIFGIVGNVMSMKVFWQPDMWKLKSGSRINQILFVIGITDTLFLVAKIISVGLVEAAGPGGLSDALDLTLPITHPLQGFAYICSMYLLILLTFERFIAIYGKSDWKTYMEDKTKTFIGIVILFSLIWNLPKCFKWKWKWETVTQRTGIVFTVVSKEKSYKDYYATYGYAIIGFFIPLVILIVLNSLIVKQLYNLKKDIDVGILGDEKKKEERQTRRRITKMCLFLVGVFMICNITDCIWWLVPNPEEFPQIFTCTTDFAATLNSSVNVIIYSVFGKSFREKFATVFCPPNKQQTNKQGGKLNIDVNKQTNAMRSTLFTETTVPSKPQVVHLVKLN